MQENPKVHIYCQDDRITRLMEVNLKARGFEANKTKESQKLCQEVATKPTDLIIFDVNGDKQEDDLLLLSSLAHAGMFPIVVISRNAQIGSVIQEQKIPVSEVFICPFDTNELMDKVKAILGSSN